MWFLQLLFVIFIPNSDAVIFSLNKTEFYLMPPVFLLDPYEQCLYENNATGVYCHAKFDLVADGPSDLYYMIQEYSAREETHFNHTQLSYGICLTKTCKHLYTNNTTGDRKLILEACLNETLWRDYQLKAKINHHFSCSTAHDESRTGLLDYVVAFAFLAIIGINILECFREIYYGTDKCPQGNDFLSCFSISQNWSKLTATSDGPDPRLSKLRYLMGTKSVITFTVLLGHILYPALINMGNVSDLDSVYRDVLFNLLANGTIMMQAFFGIAGFLLAYNFEILAEKRKVSSAWIPMAVIHRWAKLFAPYVVIVAFNATWMRYFGWGPLWEMVTVREVESCRRNWWKNLLFINNYINDTPPSVTCMTTTWYIATELQLHILGVLILVLTSGLWRKISMGALILIGLTATAAHTYYQDLDATLTVKPEFARNLFYQVPTFDYVYKHTHINLPGYFAGVATGLLVFHLSKTGFNLQRYVRHRYLGTLNVLAILLLVAVNGLMYSEGPRPSLLVRTAYAVLSKMLMIGLVSSFLILYSLLEDDIGKDFMSWRGWAVPSRLAFSIYLVHFIVIKCLGGISTTLVYFTPRLIWENVMGNLCLIFAAAFLFHLLFEAPFNQLIKMYLLPTKSDNATIKGNNHQEPEENNIIKTREFVTEAKPATRFKGD